MRVTTKGARAFFLWTLCAFVVMMLVIGYQMANAFNLSPFTYQIRERGVSANYAYISGDTLYMNNMAVSVAAVLKAVALQADTLRGSSNIVGILDSALRIDPDSSSAVNVITFGGYGGGLRWNRATDKVQFTNDFSTWTDIGSGGSGSAGAEIHDSLDANWATFTAGGGTDQDSTFNAHRSQRWLPHPSLTGQYIGASTDSGFTEHVDSTSGNAYTRYWTPIWYWEIVPDSALPTWGRVEAAIAANGGGDITGVLANDWLTGSASSGDVSLGIDPDILAALYLGGDTTFLAGTVVKLTDNIAGTLTMGAGSIYWDGTTIYHAASTSVDMNVAGGSSEFQIAALNQIYFGDTTKIRVPRGLIPPYAILYDSADYNVRGIAAGAANTAFMGAGTSAPPTFRSLVDADIPNTITIDSATGAARASLLIAGQGTANTFGRLNGDSLYTDTLNVGTRAKTASLAVGSDAFITDITGDGLAISGGALIASLGQAIVTGEITDGTILWADLDSLLGVKQYVRAIYHDSIAADFGATMTITGNWVNTTNPWAVNEGGTGAATFTQNGILYGNATSAIGVTAQGASGTVLHGNGGTPTFSAVVTGDVTDGTLTGADMATGTIDSIRLGTACVKAAELDTTVTYTVGSLRTRLANNGGIFSNNYQVRDADSTLKIGGGGGITVGSNITLGTDITDDTSIVTLASEWAGMVLARGYRDDSTKYWDSVTIRGGSDSYGNYIEFGKLGSDTTGTTLRRRHLQVAIPVPMDADTVYDVALSYRVFDGTGGESTYVRLKWSTTPFDSTNIFKTAYTELDSTNGTTFDTLSAAYARTSISRGSKIYALVTGLLYDKHVTWVRCYDLIMTYHRRYL